MIADLKPYPEYKPSGSNWLGDVPAHWEVRNMRTLIARRAERDRPDLPLLSVARERGVFVRSMTDAAENHNVIPEDLTSYKVARAGNLVINKMKAWQGSMGIAPCDGIVSPAYFVFDFRIANHAYGEKLLRSRPYVSHFGQASDGVRVGQWDLSIPGMRQIPVLVPLPEEQAAIVRFLDWANSRLERTIRAKRKVIALLNEQKQAIIHRAVTRGLDPDVPLKDSGISWIGAMPSHWEILSLKRVLRRLVDCEHKTAPKVNGTDLLVVRTTAVRGGELRLHGTYPTSEVAFSLWTRRAIPEAGDVIFTREAPAGEACIIPKGMNVCLGQRTVLIRPNSERIDSQFLIHMIYGGPPRLAITLASQGSTVAHFNMSDIGAMTVFVPPIEEQSAIVAAIDQQTAGIVVTISRLENEIELLREYRTRLVADVVTGKLDVRAVAATLPGAPAQGDDHDAGFDDDTLDDTLDDAPDADDMDAAA